MKNSEIVHDLLQVNRELPIGPEINQDTLTCPSQNLSLDVGLQPYDLLIKTIFSKRNFVIVHPLQHNSDKNRHIWMIPQRNSKVARKLLTRLARWILSYKDTHKHSLNGFFKKTQRHSRHMVTHSMFTPFESHTHKTQLIFS